MPNKTLFTLLACSLALAAGFAYALETSTPPDNPITFPIAELGNCQDKTGCKAYCDDTNHFEACMTFAKEHHIFNDDQIKKGRDELSQGRDKLIDVIETSGGPGQCKTKDECKEYCKNPDHITECADFAKAYGLLPKDRAQKIQKEFGTGPGECKSQKDCREYCQQEDHQQECLQFAKNHDLIDKDRAEKIEDLLKNGGPGSCTSKDQCEQYCKDHEDECLAFAKEHHLISQDQEDNVNNQTNIVDIIKESGGPGGCTAVDACKTYCQDKTHAEECMAFAAAHGRVSNTKAKDILRRFIKEKSEENDEDTDEQIQKRLKKFEEFKQLEKTFRIPEINGSAHDQKTFVGPGGCTSSTECIKYCSEHKEECFKKNADRPNTNSALPSILNVKPNLLKELTPEQKELLQQKMLQLKEQMMQQDRTTNTTQIKEEYCRLHPEQCKPQTPTPGQPFPPLEETNPASFMDRIKQTFAGSLFEVLFGTILLNR